MKVRRTITAAALLAASLVPAALAAPPPEANAQPKTGHHVRVTFYLWTGNPMYSGQYPFVGAAACSWNFPLGTQLMFPDGWVVTCLDRGMLGWNGWVDVYVPSYRWGLRHVEADYGIYSTVTVTRWGYGY